MPPATGRNLGAVFGYVFNPFLPDIDTLSVPADITLIAYVFDDAAFVALAGGLLAGITPAA
jgi:hypothetical protein